MNLRVYSNCWRRKGRGRYSEPGLPRLPGGLPGLTLIEVLLGLALLGSLLAAVALAKARITVQSAMAQRQLRAVAAADQWLAEQWPTSGGIPATGEGLLPGEDEFAWRIVPANNSALEEIQARSVLLEVIDQRLKTQDPVVLTLELVLPDSDEGTNSE